MSQLRFDGRVAIITGAGGGLGAAYSKELAARGAKILVNDLSKENADKCVKEIQAAGGEAIANYDSVLEGDKLVKQAVDKWGTVDILINNAGILRDKSFKAMSDKEWDIIHDVHVRGAYSCAHACWPIFRKNKFGRIINTASAAGIYGNFGQANYSAAKMALVSFARTLAREGTKYNIHANAIGPIAASQMTATIMPPEMLEKLNPGLFIPIVIYLLHEKTEDNGDLFEGGAGWFGKLRWQRSKGVVFKADDTFTPSAVAAKWDEINNFDKSDFPSSLTDTDYLGLLEQAKAVKSNDQGSKEVRYDGKTAIVTGAGAGLGRAYALMFAKLGANVIVNDVSKENAEKVVNEIKKAGGKAAANTSSVEDGEAVVQSAIDAFGGLHILVNNAGILRDKSFAAMTDAEWDLVYKIHVRGTYKTSHAAWPIFHKQKYGRIINTTSAVGIHGNFGQANYSTAKGAILGFTQTLAVEGKKYNIIANTIAPNAGTAMTATIWPEEMVKAFSPAFVAPVVGYLASEECKTTRGLFEVSGGWVAATRQQRAHGYAFSSQKPTTAESVKAKWDLITRFDDKATNPTSAAESNEPIMGNFENTGEDEEGGSGGGDLLDDYTDSEDSELAAKAKKQQIEPYEYTYTDRDSILYNIGIGATEKQLDYTYEGSSDFQVLPTFGVMPQFGASSTIPLDFLPNFSPMMLLHGEQYLAIKGEIPTSATMVTHSQFAEILDKGKAASVTLAMKTVNQETGELIFENHSTLFIRGSGGFGGRKSGKDRGASTAVNKPPSRDPDAVVEEKTLERQAAIYRLAGDRNPLHIDPAFAAVGGFDKPILHGLCFFGISGKHVYEKYGKIKDIKVRFAGSVYPGETVQTLMWKEGNKVIFVAKCKERGTTVLSSAAATLA